MERRGRVTGLASVVGAASLWALGAAVASRLFDRGVDPIELAEARAFIALAGFAAFPSAWKPWRRGGWGRLAVLGVAIALVNLTYYVAIDRIPVAVALVLQYTAPALIVAFTAVAARRRPPRDVTQALIAAFAGVVLVVGLFSGAGGRLDPVGVAMAIGAAVFFAAYTLLAERTGTIHGPVAAMMRAFLVASAVWVVYQAPAGWPETVLQPAHLPGVLYVGVMGTLAPFFLYVWGVHRVLSERAAIAATLEPVLAGMVAWLWLGQALTGVQILGGLLVVAAVIRLQLGRREPLVAPEV